ncbi:hypothetical protein Gura_0389 [Geotalea uraniireducens Rf4]|uniref:Uncharacterized protein n=2 Tax=Geotalea uraniireducens TaxID=351604 RepID=A5GCT5_GEOUR|nr:hypothetical protein Gura_0389 [Geotalea uraniireducens Rf4]
MCGRLRFRGAWIVPMPPNREDGRGENNMEPKNSIAEVRGIMLDYAALTGVSPPGKTPRRYLWTDAFALCNLLELFRQTNDGEWLDLALRLVDQVHHILGRHRSDDPRNGWISGLDEAEGESHPTRGGLRIGKRLNERGPGEPPDEPLEWEQDGQYFHYLTKWMHALSRMSRVTGVATYAGWAMELAQTAHAAFVPASRSGAKRMYWKMSIDLSRPLVPSMGQHDPLDGYVTYCELQASAAAPGLSLQFDLKAEIADMAAICRGKEWSTDDPLGIGGLLWDAWRIAQLTDMGGFRDTSLLESIVDAALAGLQAFAEGNPLKYPAAYRLAFRELGLSIGLKVIVPLRGWSEKNLENPLLRKIEALAGYLSLAEEIEGFWLEWRNRETETWREHREINMVMLATSLAPNGFLSI